MTTAEEDILLRRDFPFADPLTHELTVKYLIFKLTSAMSSGFLLLPASHDGSGLTFFVHRAEADSQPTE